MTANTRTHPPPPSVWARRIPYAIVLAVGGLAFAFPMYWMVRSSLIDLPTYLDRPIHWLPTPISGSAFTEIWASYDFVSVAFHTTLVAVVITAGNVIFDAMAGYAFARIRFRGRNILFGLFLATLAVSPELLIIPQFLIVRSLGLYDTFGAIVLPYLATPFSVFLMRQFFLKMPIEIEEAARIDGASRLRIFWSIALPMAKPALATVAVINFIEGWQLYVWPLVATAPDGRWDLMQTLIARTVQVLPGGTSQVDWPELMAASLIATLPVLVVFVIAQRWFVAGLTGGGVKG